MIEYEYADLFLQDSVDKQLHITFDTGEFDNTDLNYQAFEIHESLCSEPQLKFGACEASKIQFTIGKSELAYIGKRLHVSEVIGGHTEAPLSIGYYTVVSDKPTADRFGRVITAYDDMYLILNEDMTDWWNNLPSAFTVKYLRDALADYFNITQMTISLVNDGITINRPTLKSVSGKDIITAICEINACFGHMGRDGKLNYLFLREVIEGLYPANDLYPEDDLYPREERIGQIVNKQHYMNAWYEDYMTQRITRINVYNSENELKASQGTGTNVYNITGNILINGMNNQTAQYMVANVYSDMATVWYMPCSLECVGTPCIEVGDSLRLNTNDKIIYTYVLERTLRGIQTLTDSIDAQGEEYRTDDMNSLAKQVSAVSAQAQRTAENLEATNDNVSAVGSVASAANNLAGTANTAARNAQDTADGAITRIQRIESDYITTNDLSAINATIQSLNTTVANINRAYIDEATCKRIVSNSIDSYFAHLSSLVVSGNISCRQITMNGTTFTRQQATVRLANGGTKLMTYLGF